jgi:hypothetical protein
VHYECSFWTLGESAVHEPLRPLRTPILERPLAKV